MPDEPNTNRAHVLQMMWLHTWGLSVIVYFAVFAYALFFFGRFDAKAIGEAFAGTAAILIGFSFALSGFCYYFDFLDQKLFYRKFLGLVGFWYACGYVASLIIRSPERYLWGLGQTVKQPEAILGIAAMIIFAFMAAISNHQAMQRLGCGRWRQALRLGYLAYISLIVRALLIEGQDWVQWISHPRALPSPRLLVTIFAIFVLALRASMIIMESSQLKRAGVGKDLQNGKVC